VRQHRSSQPRRCEFCIPSRQLYCSNRWDLDAPFWRWVSISHHKVPPECTSSSARNRWGMCIPKKLQLVFPYVWRCRDSLLLWYASELNNGNGSALKTPPNHKPFLKSCPANWLFLFWTRVTLAPTFSRFLILSPETLSR